MEYHRVFTMYCPKCGYHTDFNNDIATSYRQNYKDRVILGVIDWQKKLWCANTHSEPGQFSSDTAQWLASCPYCVVEQGRDSYANTEVCYTWDRDSCADIKVCYTWNVVATDKQMQLLKKQYKNIMALNRPITKELASILIKEEKTMQKPNNFENTKTGGDFTPIELGGHHLIIKNVEETTSKAGSPMLKVYFDFGKNDRQPDYMATEFKNDIRPDKKWPHAGTQYILTEDKDGNCSKSFKSFITAFENSNNCSAIWGDKFAGQFKNKKIGGVFGEVENEYNGKTSMRHELRWFCADDKVDTASTPEARYLNGKASDTLGAPSNSQPDVNVAEGTDEEVPW